MTFRNSIRTAAGSCAPSMPSGQVGEVQAILPDVKGTLHPLVLVVLTLARASSVAAPADLVVRHANVVTMDAAAPRAQAFAVTGEQFVMVGDEASVSALIGPSTRVLELRGKTVVPGFIDAHAHPGPEYPEDSPWAAVDCRPNKVRTIEALVAALKAKAGRTPAGQWVTGTRYQETKLGRHPTRWDLDRASTNHPIIISHSSGHQSVGNSLALELAKVSRDSADPAGGKFVRDERGELTGLLQERAAGMVRSAGPRRPAPPPDAQPSFLLPRRSPNKPALCRVTAERPLDNGATSGTGSMARGDRRLRRPRPNSDRASENRDGSGPTTPRHYAADRCRRFSG